MNDRKQPESASHHRLIGEGAPRWLTIGFALLGVCIAVGAVWLWMIGQPGESPATASTGQAVLPPPSAAAPPSVVETQTAQIPPLTSREEPVTTPAEANATAPVADTGTESEQAPPPEREAIAGGSESVPATTVTLAEPAKEPCPSTVIFSFNRGSAAPLGDSNSVLQGLYDWLQSHPQAEVLVVGYADSVGDDSYNVLLSYRRAKSVAALIDRMALPAQRMTIRAAGSTDPLPGVPGNAKENRRVTVQINGTPECQPSSSEAP